MLRLSCAWRCRSEHRPRVPAPKRRTIQVQPAAGRANQTECSRNFALCGRKMKRRTTIAALALALALALLFNARPGSAQTGDRALSPEEIRALVARAVANQRRNDAALEEYERVERRQLRKSQSGTSRAEDKTFRVVPTGSGTERVQTEERGQPVDAEFYRGQLRNLEQALVGSLNPGEARHSQRVANAAKRSREHAEMLDAVGNAFRFTWLGREARNGRTLVKLHLEPNPDYKPASRITSLLGAVRATAWLDEAAGQMVRIEAELAATSRSAAACSAR